MVYRHKITGVQIETKSACSGDLWEEVKEQAPETKPKAPAETPKKAAKRPQK